MGEGVHLQTAIFTVAGVAAVLGLGYVLWRMLARGKVGRASWTYSRLILAALSAGIAVSVLVAVVLSQQHIQVFALSGLAKRVILPATYLSFAIILLFGRRSPSPVKPMWWTLLLLITLLSSAFNFITLTSNPNLSSVAQGALLVAGFLIIAAVGMRAPHWTTSELTALILILAVPGVTTEPMRIRATPYDVVAVPTAVALLYVSWRSRRHRVLTLVGGIGLLAIQIPKIQTDQASFALIAQFAVCSAVLALAVVPRLVRAPLAVVGLFLTGWLVANSQLWQVFVGGSVTAWDVTLVQRSYEARVVSDLVGLSPITFLVGAGPGATVDLRNSPDVTTLTAAGRELSAVDDVHLLTSWLLLKFGLLGLIWLVILLTAVGRLAAKVLSAKVPDATNVLLLLLAAAGLANAVPASTYIFTNPVLALSLGILTARLMQNPSDYSKQSLSFARHRDASRSRSEGVHRRSWM